MLDEKIRKSSLWPNNEPAFFGAGSVLEPSQNGRFGMNRFPSLDSPPKSISVKLEVRAIVGLLVCRS